MNKSKFTYYLILLLFELSSENITFVGFNLIIDCSFMSWLDALVVNSTV